MFYIYFIYFLLLLPSSMSAWSDSGFSGMTVLFIDSRAWLCLWRSSASSISTSSKFLNKYLRDKNKAGQVLFSKIIPRLSQFSIISRVDWHSAKNANLIHWISNFRKTIKNIFLQNNCKLSNLCIQFIDQYLLDISYVDKYTHMMTLFQPSLDATYESMN